MWFEQRRDWWREALSNVKILIFLMLLPRRLLRLVFCLLGAIECELGLDLCHFDAEQAFVQSSLDEDGFIRLRPGCSEMSGKK